MQYAFSAFWTALMLSGLLAVSAPGLAHWDGATAVGVLDRAWWESLQPKGSGLPCCDIADGQKVLDVDWDTAGPNNSYRVRLNGRWIVVPDAAVVRPIASVPRSCGPIRTATV
jgi:hypothetical protein